MASATKALMRAALADRANQRFALLSEACVPLYAPQVKRKGGERERERERWRERELLEGAIEPVTTGCARARAPALRLGLSARGRPGRRDSLHPPF